jgi:hypothetical protein
MRGDPATRQYFLDNVPIQLGCRYTTTQLRATSGNGFCGLHALLRMRYGLLLIPKQKPDLSALIYLIKKDHLLPLCSTDWPDALRDNVLRLMRKSRWAQHRCADNDNQVNK